MADGGLSVGGLASGLDTTSIINGLIAIESQRVTTEQNKKSAVELKLATFNDLKTKLSDFYTQAKSMDSTSVFNVFASSSSDETIAKISGEDGATQGNYDVTVTSLASSLKVASKSYANSSASLGYTGSFNVSVSAAALKADPTVANVQVDIAATDTLKDIAGKINRTKGTGATASVIQMGTNDYRLMLTSVDEGTRAFTLDQVSGQSVLSNGLDLLREALPGVSSRESIRTDFDFRLAAGGAATSTSTFSSLFNSIGSSSAITANDKINIAGTKADGTAVSGIFNIATPGTTTVGNLMTAVQTAFGGAASVDVSLNSSGEIVVTDKTTGTTNMALTMSFNDADASGSLLGVGTSKVRSEFKNVIADGQNAFYSLNAMSLSSQTNKDNTTVAGTVFELKKADPTQNVKLTLDYDRDGIKKKVQTYLDSYNSLIKFLDDKSKIEVKQSDPTSAITANTNKTTINKGPFAGDSSILGLKSQIQAMMTSNIPELTSQGLSKYASLASMGITSDQNTGFLVINDTSFNTALDQDFEGVKRVFVTNGYMTNSAHSFGTYTSDTKTGVYDINPATGGFDTDKTTGTSYSPATIAGDGDLMNSDNGDSKGMAVQAAPGSGVGKVVFIRGVAGQIKDFYDKINNFVDGFLSTTVKNYNDQMKDEDTQIAKLESHVATVKEQLTKQFANLELSISKLQSQSAAFSGQVKK